MEQNKSGFVAAQGLSSESPQDFQKKKKKSYLILLLVVYVHSCGEMFPLRRQFAPLLGDSPPWGLQRRNEMEKI